MGKRSDWHCQSEGCDVVIKHVSGGPDRGMRIITQTRKCTDCDHIQDYVTDELPDGSSVLRWLDTTQPRSPEKRPTQGASPGEPRCTKCGGRTIAWDRRCPVCGGQMKGGYGPIVMWD